jgi:hypothetical protein
MKNLCQNQNSSHQCVTWRTADEAAQIMDICKFYSAEPLAVG